MVGEVSQVGHLWPVAKSAEITGNGLGAPRQGGTTQGRVGQGPGLPKARRKPAAWPQVPVAQLRVPTGQ